MKNPTKKPKKASGQSPGKPANPALHVALFSGQIPTRDLVERFESLLATRLQMDLKVCDLEAYLRKLTPQRIHAFATQLRANAEAIDALVPSPAGVMPRYFDRSRN